MNSTWHINNLQSAINCKYSIFASFFIFIFIIVNLIEGYLFVPNLGFWFYWNNSELVVYSSQNELVLEGDIIKGINGKPLVISEQIFPRIKEGFYEFEIIRNNELVKVTIEKLEGDLEVTIIDVSTSIVALLTWGIGFYLVISASVLNWIRIGLVIQIFSLLLSSIFAVTGGFLIGYFVGTVLITFFPYLIILVILFPYKSHSKLAILCKYIFFIGSILLFFGSILTTYGGLNEVLGINQIINITTFFALTSIISSLIILAQKIKISSSPNEKTNTKIILGGSSITLFFSVLSIGLGTILRIEYPIYFIYGLLLLHPLTYLLVFLRETDSLIDQKIVSTFKYLILAFSGLFLSFGVISTIEQRLNLDEILKNIVLSIFIVSLIFLSSTRNKNVEEKIKDILFQNSINDNYVEELARIINKNPNEESLSFVLERLCSLLNLKKGLIIGIINDYKEIKLGVGLSDEEINKSSSLIKEHLESDWKKHQFQIKNEDIIIGILQISNSTFGDLNDYELLFIEKVADLLGIGLRMIRLNYEANLLTERVLFIEEEAKTRIATELHNQPLQDISVIYQNLKTSFGDDELDGLIKALKEVSTKIRLIIAGIQPQIINEPPYWIVKAKSSDFEEKNSEIEVMINLSKELMNLNARKNVRSALYHIITESFNNIMKHSNATTVKIIMEKHQSAYATITIQDNGKGFIKKAPEELLLNNHFGIASIYKWANIANGLLSIEGDERVGTKVVFEFPLIE